MSLFTKDGRPLKFSLIGLPEETEMELRKLINDNGGEVFDSEDPWIVMFTAPESYVKGKRMFDIKFIRECIRKHSLLDLEKFKLGESNAFEGCIMSLLVYDTPYCMYKNQLFSNPERPIVVPPQRTASNHVLEIPAVNELESSKITVNQGGGDIPDQPQAVASDDNKRPCHIEYETEVAPKMLLWNIIQQRKQARNSTPEAPTSKSKLNSNQSLEETNDRSSVSPDESEPQSNSRNQKPPRRLPHEKQEQQKTRNQIRGRSKVAIISGDVKTSDSLLQHASKKQGTFDRRKKTDATSENTNNLKDCKAEVFSSARGRQSSKRHDTSNRNSSNFSESETEGSDDNLNRSPLLPSRCSTTAEQRRERHNSHKKPMSSKNDERDGSILPNVNAKKNHSGLADNEPSNSNGSNTNREKSPILGSAGRQIHPAKYYLEKCAPFRTSKMLSKLSKQNQNQAKLNENDSNQSAAQDSADKKSFGSGLNNSSKGKKSLGVTVGKTSGEKTRRILSRKRTNLNEPRTSRVEDMSSSGSESDDENRILEDSKRESKKPSEPSKLKRDQSLIRERDLNRSSVQDSGNEQLSRSKQNNSPKAKKNQGLNEKKTSGGRTQKTFSSNETNRNKFIKARSMNGSSSNSESDDENTVYGKDITKSKNLSKPSKQKPNQTMIINNNLNRSKVQDSSGEQLSSGGLNNSLKGKKSQGQSDKKTSKGETQKTFNSNKTNRNKLIKAVNRSSSSSESDDDNTTYEDEITKSKNLSKSPKQKPDKAKIINNDLNQSATQDSGSMKISGNKLNSSTKQKNVQSVSGRRNSIEEPRKRLDQNKSNPDKSQKLRTKNSCSESDDDSTPLRTRLEESKKFDNRNQKVSQKTVSHYPLRSDCSGSGESSNKDGDIRKPKEPENIAPNESTSRNRTNVENSVKKLPGKAEPQKKFRKLYRSSPETCHGIDLSPDVRTGMDSNEKKNTGKGPKVRTIEKIELLNRINEDRGVKSGANKKGKHKMIVDLQYSETRKTIAKTSEKPQDRTASDAQSDEERPAVQRVDGKASAKRKMSKELQDTKISQVQKHGTDKSSAGKGARQNTSIGAEKRLQFDQAKLKKNQDHLKRMRSRSLVIDTSDSESDSTHCASRLKISAKKIAPNSAKAFDYTTSKPGTSKQDDDQMKLRESNRRISYRFDDSDSPGTSKQDDEQMKLRESNRQISYRFDDSDSESSNRRGVGDRERSKNRRSTPFSSDDSEDEMPKQPRRLRGDVVHKKFLESLSRNYKKQTDSGDRNFVGASTSANSGDASEHQMDFDDGKETRRNDRKRSRYPTIDVEIQGSSSKKPRKEFYTRNISIHEQIDMIKYLIEEDAIDSGKGKDIWKRYIIDRKNTHRTIWSLWENFRKSILPKIEYFNIPATKMVQFKRLRTRKRK